MGSYGTSGNNEVARRFREVRALTERLVAGLEPEDFVVQSMPDASPLRWHLAHTTWFFETFLLAAVDAGYRKHSESYEYLFNSYYNSVGQPFPRARRGLLTRPTVREILEYRRVIDERIEQWLASAEGPNHAPWLAVVELGCHHEQQHQELMLTDLKHAFSCNPLNPAYRELPAGTSVAMREPAFGRDAPGSGASGATAPVRTASDPQDGWCQFDEGLREIGMPEEPFAFDNERPRHRVFLEAFELARQPVTNGQYLAFLDDDGYRRPEFWLSAGWAWVCQEQREAPLYWLRDGTGWRQFTLYGCQPLDPAQPVCHLSYYEADAFARWSGARLPTEAEWESAAQGQPVTGNFVESGVLHPQPALADGRPLAAMFGDVWEWTASSYAAYPGYAPAAGALGEYNGKFMCNQMVLRGGSCATTQSHIRPSYRNFFPPEAQWQFSGIRLAR